MNAIKKCINIHLCFLYKCNGRCDTFDNKCGNTCTSNKAKDVRAFNIITRINEAIKQMVEDLIQVTREMKNVSI